MPLFIIETTAESPIREFWQVEAESAQQARDKFEAGQVGAFLWDEVQGDETEREVAQVHPRADLAGTIALHNAQQEAPAMLAALGHALQALEGDWERTREVDEIRAILSRIDGAPTAEPAAPISEAAPVTREKPICRECGGDSVIQDASVRWNVETQEYEASDPYDKSAYCDDCDGETRLVWVTVGPDGEPIGGEA